MPNTSVEGTRTGMAAPWPRSAVVHHALRGQGATPLRVPHLERQAAQNPHHVLA